MPRFKTIFSLISLLVVIGLVGACGDKNSAAKAEKKAAAATKSKNPDTYVHVTISDVDSLDPAWSYDTQSHMIIENIYDYLVTYKGGSVNDLEARISNKVPSQENGLLSEDGLTYTFPIRKGVKFHKGGEVTPNDVAYSLQRFMLFDRAGGPSSLLLEPITGLTTTRSKDGKPLDEAYTKVMAAVTVDGDYVVLKIHKPFSPILSILASWAPIISKEWAAAHNAWDGTKENWKKHNNPDKTAEGFHDQENGTGPFMLDRWDKKTKETVLARFDDYWRGPAKLKRAHIKSVDEFQTRKLMLAAGDADSIYADYLQQPLLKNLPGVELIDDLPRIDMNPAIFFVFKIETKGNPNVGSGKLDGKGIPANFFADINVRKGFASAFDYEGFIKDVNRGKGTRAQSFIPKGLFGYNADQAAYPYDIDAAEAFFKKAHGGVLWKKGFKFTLAYNAGNQPREVIANMIKRAVESINPKFQIDTRPIQWSTYLDLSNKSKLPMFILGWAPDYPDPHNFAFPYMHSDGNYPRLQRYKNAEADKLVTAAMTERDLEKRKAMYFRLQEIAYEDVPTLFVLNSVLYRTQRTWVKGYTYNPIHPDAPYSCPLYYLSKE
ncbi:MAG: peptide ABC transporter substrate-binding protein [Elusimicrobia bacterium]|nr:MAG: peptide ABC transporter substrate-binding protein [Elusimicrobiota bacterium]